VGYPKAKLIYSAQGLKYEELLVLPNASKCTGTGVAPDGERSKYFVGGNTMESKKYGRFLAASLAASFLIGGSWAQAQVIPPPPPVIVDTDNDGVPDEDDQCPASDFSSTIVINGVDTGIQSGTANPAGCTAADLMVEMIETCLADAKNHGRFVRCVSHETNLLKRAKTITGKQKGQIQRIVAKMRLTAS
jgi:hypothetical protein